MRVPCNLERRKHSELWFGEDVEGCSDVQLPCLKVPGGWWQKLGRDWQ
jgi:hypothetical protein